MDLSRIKHFITRNGDRVLIVENGEPEMVLMSFEEYEKMADASGRGLRPPAAFQTPSAASPTAEDLGFFRETKIAADPFDSPARFDELPGDESSASADSRQMFRNTEEVRLEDLPL